MCGSWLRALGALGSWHWIWALGSLRGPKAESREARAEKGPEPGVLSPAPIGAGVRPVRGPEPRAASPEHTLERPIGSRLRALGSRRALLKVPLGSELLRSLRGSSRRYTCTPIFSTGLKPKAVSLTPVGCVFQQ